MKFRYLKINGILIWGTNELTKADLVAVKQRNYDTIIDLSNGTQYDASENQWVEIKGDA